MPSAEIIAIGTELVLGQTQDANISKISKKLNSIGIDVFRASIVGDNKKRISDEINQSSSRADIVITTGGLGPTVDDPTREAVADSFGLQLEYHPELWQEIVERFHSFSREPTENNKRQAYIPIGANPIHNPVGTAPAFYIKRANQVLISLPGVPHEMEFLLENNVVPLLRKIFEIQTTIFSKIVHTAAIGESQLDEKIGDMEMYTNPTVGLVAYPGCVDIRITAKAKDEIRARQMIEPIENEIKHRLGIKVFGTDGITLPESVRQTLSKYGFSLNLYYENACVELAELLFKTGLFTEKNGIEEEESAQLTPRSPSYQNSKYNKKNRNYLFLFVRCSNHDHQIVDLLLTDIDH